MPAPSPGKSGLDRLAPSDGRRDPAHGGLQCVRPQQRRPLHGGVRPVAGTRQRLHAEGRRDHAVQFGRDRPAQPRPGVRADPIRRHGAGQGHEAAEELAADLVGRSVAVAPLDGPFRGGGPPPRLVLAAAAQEPVVRVDRRSVVEVRLRGQVGEAGRVGLDPGPVLPQAGDLAQPDLPGQPPEPALPPLCPRQRCADPGQLLVGTGRPPGRVAGHGDGPGTVIGGSGKPDGLVCRPGREGGVVSPLGFGRPGCRRLCRWQPLGRVPQIDHRCTGPGQCHAHRADGVRGLVLAGRAVRPGVGLISLPIHDPAGQLHRTVLQRIFRGRGPGLRRPQRIQRPHPALFGLLQRRSGGQPHPHGDQFALPAEHLALPDRAQNAGGEAETQVVRQEPAAVLVDPVAVIGNAQRSDPVLPAHPPEQLVDGDVGGREQQHALATPGQLTDDLADHLGLAGPGWPLDEVGVRAADRPGNRSALLLVEGHRLGVLGAVEPGRLGLYGNPQLLRPAQQGREVVPVPLDLATEEGLQRLLVFLETERPDHLDRHDLAS